jgi:hypothetical protein
MESERIRLFQDIKTNGEFNGTYPEFISKYFSAQGAFEGFHTSMVNNGDYTKPLKDFYKKLGCDLSWAEELSYCKTSSSNNSQPSSLEDNRIFMFQNMKTDGDFTGTYQEFLSKYFSGLETVKNLHSSMVTNGDYTKSLTDFFLKYACDYSWAENESYCKKAKKTVTPTPPKKTDGETKPKERVIDLKKCKKSIDDFYPDKEKYQRDFSFEDVEDAFEREEGKHADQILYSKGTEKRQKQMCARWEDGWRPNFGKPCDETFPIEKWCSNEKMKEIQKCLGLPADRRTGIFDDLTMSKLRAKGITPEESEDISEDEYRKICNKVDYKKMMPSKGYESPWLDVQSTYVDLEEQSILNQHLNFKKILEEKQEKIESGYELYEQFSIVDPTLKKAIDAGCIPKKGYNTKIEGKKVWMVPVEASTPREAGVEVGDTYIFYPDGTLFYQKNGQEGKIEIASGWECDYGQQAMESKGVGDWTRLGWKLEQDVDQTLKNNPLHYLKTAVQGAPGGFMFLPTYMKSYVPKFPVGTAQQEWLSGLTQTYGTIVINPRPQAIEDNDLRPYKIPLGDNFFPNGLTVYYDPTKAGTQDPSLIRAQSFRDATKISIVKCEKYIENYWESYRRGLVNPTRFMFQEEKELVQACARQYYDQWKPQIVSVKDANGNTTQKKETIGGVAGVGGGRNKLNKILKALAGVEDYDGTKRTTANVGRQTNPWRITLPNV